jgi:TetR/AcrR family transcriptional regulator
VLRSFFEQAFRGLEKVLAENQKVEAKVRRLVGYYIDYYQQNSRFVRLLQRELADGGQDVLALLKDSKGARQGLSPQTVIDFFAEASRQGVIRPLDPRHAVLSMIGMCVVMFMIRPILPAMLGLDAERPEAFEQRKIQVSELLLKGLLNPKHQG